jgi:hypothetical protein
MALKKRMAGAATLGAAMLIGFGLPQAQAAYTLTVQPSGAGVTATGTGSINFDALALFGDELDTSLIAASDGAIIVGPTTPTDDTYHSGITGPAIAFGTGDEFLADTGGAPWWGSALSTKRAEALSPSRWVMFPERRWGRAPPPGPTRPS